MPTTKKQYVLVCVSCDKKFSEEQTVSNCLSCGGSLDVIYTNIPKIKVTLKDFINKNSYDFLRSFNLLPTAGDKLITLHEGNTPLIFSEKIGKKMGLNNFYMKFEGANPTGVFKDRGTAVEITKAIQMGAKAVTCASTGNMAASVAAYCAKANIPCYVVIPEKTPMGKLAQAIAYGAKVLKVRGDYADCVKLSVEMAKFYKFYLAGDYVFRSEGQKALAFELIQQLNGKTPDWVIVPVGCGTNLSAIYKGFQELVRVGLIKKVPKFIAVQPDNMPTIVSAFHNKQKHYKPVKPAFTVASAVGITTPLDDVKVLNALYDSKGYAESASEGEILSSQKLLGNLQAIFVEPSGALPIAILQKLLAKKIIKKDDLIVAVLTGNGLKDAQSILSGNVDSPVIEPTMSELKRYFAMGMENKSKVFLSKDKQQKIWKNLPTKSKLKTEIKKLFGVTVSDITLTNIITLLESFKEKQKAICQGDLEYALETVLKMPEKMPRKIVINDFSVHSTQHQSAEAWVEIMFNGEKIASRAKGVGPVDAITAAIRDGIKDKDKIGTELTYYNVEINTAGTDAVVEVSLSLKGNNGKEVTGEAASPDVIVASIKAFENAYNLLSFKSNQK